MQKIFNDDIVSTFGRLVGTLGKPQTSADAGETKLQAKRQVPAVKPVKPSKKTIDGLFKKAGAPAQKQAELATPARSCTNTLDNTTAAGNTAFRHTHTAQNEDREEGESHAQHLHAAPSKSVADRLAEGSGAQDESADTERKGSYGGADQFESSHQDHAASTRKAAESGREGGTVDPHIREGPRNDRQPAAQSNSSSRKERAFSKEDLRERTVSAEARQAKLSVSNLSAANGAAQENASSHGQESSQGVKIIPGQDHSSVGFRSGSATGEESKEEAKQALDPSLQGIDMREQKRIMHEIWVQNNLRQADRSPTKQARKQSHSTSSNIAKQPRLTDRFFKRA